MITLSDGRKDLYQWDTGRELLISVECNFAHFSNGRYKRTMDVEVKEGKARIPDELLQDARKLKVYVFVGDADNGYTKLERAFKVIARPKPSEYVFTPTELIDLRELAKRVDELSKNIGAEIEAYLKENPIEGGKAATIKIGNVDTLPPGYDATVENSGNENDAVLDFGIPQGEDGYSPSIELTRIENGVQITATNKNGSQSQIVYDGKGGGGGEPFTFTTDETLNFSVDGVLSVNTAKEVEKDNSLPITSAAVFAEVGNINILLGTI